jgi:hypothetical protein
MVGWFLSNKLGIIWKEYFVEYYTPAFNNNNNNNNNNCKWVDT